MIDGDPNQGDGKPKVYAVEAGVAFVDALAIGLCDLSGGDPLALAGMTVMLPTRRAARALTDAFLRVRDGQALLLPRLLALADLQGDQDLLAGDEIPPALDPLRRRLILARLVMARGGAFAVAPDQALRLADALADLIDEVETSEADFAKLAELAPEEFASHWQATVEFLRIVTALWPAILEERGAIDPARRRVLALAARARHWRAHPPIEPVIAAGFISADPALAALIAAVSRLPAGAVVLPGLDQTLDNEGWDEIEPTHPQFGLKRLLEAIGIARKDVRSWPAVTSSGRDATAARRRLLSEALRPAETTEQWRTGPAFDPAALVGLSRIECDTIGEEAEVVALAMRRALETSGRTAALVTPDRGLARRVAAALDRWNIEVDDSAGRPLGLTPVGIWLRLVAEAVSSNFAPLPLLAMLKHPFAAVGLQTEDMRRRVRLLERTVLRGPRPAPGLAGIETVLDEVPNKLFENGADGKRDLREWLRDLAARLKPFIDIAAAGGAELGALLLGHAEAAEALAETPEEPGALRLWRGQDGEAAADLFARLAETGGDGLSLVSVDRYPAVLAELMAGTMVRPLYGAHPRLAIWGLIEARLQRADLMILGGLNEGSWPPLPGDEPWMSRKMRADFGLDPLEAAIGLAAQDFTLTACAPEVILTRARRVDGAPTVPARWLSRLDAVLAGSNLALPADPAAPWRNWVASIDQPDRIAPWDRPEPRPPLSARPRKLSVTAIETWVRDPYALYARHILRLGALDPLDADPGAAERGQFVHHALDRFISQSPDRLPPQALQLLLMEGRAAFGDALGHPAVAAFWWPRFERIARWFIDFEQQLRLEGERPLATEIEGGIDLGTGAARFRLTAKADRIDRLRDGSLAIIDYKTGRAPKPDQVAAGLAPQLPLEAVIAEQGGFRGIAAAAVSQLAFLQLGGGDPPGAFLPALKPAEQDAAVKAAFDGLNRLIAAFDDPATPYLSRPLPAYAFASDYDHLARVAEWSTP